MFIHKSYPILLIFFNFSSSMSFIFRPSIIISFSAAKLDKVRMALDVVMLERLAQVFSGEIDAQSTLVFFHTVGIFQEKQ